MLDFWSVTFIWANYNDVSRGHPKWWFSKGNPLISGKSRLVKYYNLARFIKEGANLWKLFDEIWPEILALKWAMTTSDTRYPSYKVRHPEVSNEKNPWGFRVYRGWDPTQLCGDYFINHDIRILIKQPGWLMESKEKNPGFWIPWIPSLDLQGVWIPSLDLQGVWIPSLDA